MSFTKPSKNILIIGHVTNKVINFKWRKCNNFFKPLIKENIKYTTSLNFLFFSLIHFTLRNYILTHLTWKVLHDTYMNILCIPFPPFWCERLSLLPNFQKVGAWQEVNFQWGIAAKDGGGAYPFPGMVTVFT